MAALMAALGIQLPQIQLPGTLSVRTPTLVSQPSQFRVSLSHRSSYLLRVSRSQLLNTRSLRVLSLLALSRCPSLPRYALDSLLSQL